VGWKHLFLPSCVRDPVYADAGSFAFQLRQADFPVRASASWHGHQRKALGRNVTEQKRGHHAIIETGTGHEHGEQQSQRSDQQRPLAPFDFLAAIIPALGASHCGGLDRLAVDARGTRGRRAPRCHAGAFTQDMDHLSLCPVVAPLRKGVIDGALGQQIMRQHVPLASAPVQIKNRAEDFPHVDRTRGPAAGALLGRREQRFHDGPLFVHETRYILL